MGSRSDFRKQQNSGLAIPPGAVPIRDQLAEAQKLRAQVQQMHMDLSSSIYANIVSGYALNIPDDEKLNLDEMVAMADVSKIAAGAWMVSWGLMQVQKQEDVEPEAERTDAPEILEEGATIPLDK